MQDRQSEKVNHVGCFGRVIVTSISIILEEENRKGKKVEDEDEE